MTRVSECQTWCGGGKWGARVWLWGGRGGGGRAPHALSRGGSAGPGCLSRRGDSGAAHSWRRRGSPNAGTVRHRTMRVGEAVVQPKVTTTAEPVTARPAEPIVVGLDGGYVRSRHRQDERHFEVIAGKVIDAHGSQSRFAFARNSPAI